MDHKHRIVSCDSWEDFKSIAIAGLFENKPFSRGLYIFRGIGSSQWSLISTFDRWYEGMDRANKQRVAERLISLFQKEAEAIDVDRSIWENEAARIALAQHNGVPTRLLDWTESPYIAAFFAFSAIGLNPNPEHPVAVWCLDTRNAIWSKEYGVEILDVPSYGNERLRSQLGRFTLLRAPYDTLEEYVSQFPGEENALTQFLVPSSEALVALADLDVMGINYSKIFPGLEGSARAARLRMQFERRASQDQTAQVSPNKRLQRRPRR